MNGIEVHPDDAITVVFRKIITEGRTIVKKLDSGPEPPPDGEIVQYYDIQTESVFEGNITIRIISDQARQGQLLQWENEQWIDRTIYCMDVGRKFKLIIGVTDHLSFFGIR